MLLEYTLTDTDTPSNHHHHQLHWFIQILKTAQIQKPLSNRAFHSANAFFPIPLSDASAAAAEEVFVFVSPSNILYKKMEKRSKYLCLEKDGKSHRVLIIIGIHIIVIIITTIIRE